MKTKVLLLLAVLAMIVYSCTTDREDEVQNPVQLEPLKTNNNKGETSKIGDTIDAPPGHQSIILDPGTGLDPNPNPTDPNEGDPKDVPPRK